MAKTDIEPIWLSTKDAATVLGTRVETIRNYGNRRDVPATASRLHQGIRYFNIGIIMAWSRQGSATGKRGRPTRQLSINREVLAKVPRTVFPS